MSVLNQPFSMIGTTFGVKVGGASVFTPFAQLGDDADFDGFENATVDIKLLANSYVVSYMGRTDYTTFGGSCYLVDSDTSNALMWSVFTARAIVAWQLQLPDSTTGISSGTTYTFSGGLVSYKPGPFSGEAAGMIAFSVRISGPVTKTVAVS